MYNTANHSYPEINVISYTNFHISVVVSKFNYDITYALLQGCLEQLEYHGLTCPIDIYWVPGVFEIPITAKRIILQKKKQVDALIALGAVIRGDTPHFDYVSSGCVQGLMNVMMTYNLPISFGILTTDNLKQAKQRSGGKYGNKGSEVATSILNLLNVYHKNNI